MAIRITCPECAKVLQFSTQPPEGKKVKCPACSHAFAPKRDEEEEASDIQEKPSGKAKAPVKKTKDAELPRKKSRDEDSDDDSPKKRRRDESDDDDDDSEEDDEPVKKKKKKKKAGAGAILYWVYRGGSVLVLLVLLAILAWILLNPRRATLNDETVMPVALGETRSRTIEAISKSQKVNISATSVSGQFDIYVFLEKDQAEVEKEINRGKATAKLLASKLKTTQAELQVTVPANERAVVQLTSADGKKTDVNLKITN